MVGAGPVGRRRARQLLAAGADVVVVAPSASATVPDLAAGGPVEVRAREFSTDDAANMFLVVAATDQPAVNDAVVAAARAAGALVNRADDAAGGDVDLTAVVRRGPLTVAVSTGGDAPAVARWAAERIDDGLDQVLTLDADGVALLVEVVSEVRAERTAAGAAAVTGDPVDWRSGLDHSMLELISRGRKAQAKERLQACLSSS